MITRRQFVAAGAATGAAVIVPWRLLRGSGARATALDGGPGLDPHTIAKYAQRLAVLPAMPRAGTVEHGAVDHYAIAVRQFRQQMLPPGLPRTTVWGYGAIGHPGTFHAPALPLETLADRQVRVRWVNQLVDSLGNYLSHPLTVDQTLHWANPAGGISGRDMKQTFTSTPDPYHGPIPLVTHLHGAHSFEESDGYPNAWFLARARNIPDGYATVGSFYDRYAAEFHDRIGPLWHPGSSVYQYNNDQRATTLWFHDHALGMTRVNIQMGLSGMYLIRGGDSDLPAGVLPGPAPAIGDPPGTRYYEIPIVVQDRSFNADGSLFFPDSRDFFGDVTPGGPFIPTTDVPPQWNPEFFGTTMIANGRVWPRLEVEPRRYRFRFLNSCNTRVVILKIASDPTAARPAPAALPIWQIGSDGGFLPAPQQLDQVIIAVAERADVVVDFSDVPVGTELYLINEGPDDPFGGGTVGVDFDPADPATTGQVMKFVVGPLRSRDTSVPPDRLQLPSLTPLGSPSHTRQVSLNELDSTTFADAPIVGLLGTMNADGTPSPKRWMDPVTETPTRNVPETWEITNFTDDAHPIHVHQIQFQVVNREPTGSGQVRGPDAGESGFKDTVLAYPGETTRIKMNFDLAGRYVWHCHIIDHEDNEMMRPLQVEE
ncbi:MAG TPA: multicopper oxidase [Mycobacteriales bacterium]|nr:multicopper oxidase [Mycobacteriales bacterium]